MQIGSCRVLEFKVLYFVNYSVDACSHLMFHVTFLCSPQL